MVKNLSYGTDCRGDYAYFIENGLIMADGTLCEEARTHTQEWVFFRMLLGGRQTPRHGWIQDNEVVQWG